MKILETLQQRHRVGKKSIAVLIDPDKAEDLVKLKHLVHLASENCIDFFFVGGSLITTPNIAEVIQSIKEDVNIPVVLFPGSSVHIDPSADAILFLVSDQARANPWLLFLRPCGMNSSQSKLKLSTKAIFCNSSAPSSASRKPSSAPFLHGLTMVRSAASPARYRKR